MHSVRRRVGKRCRLQLYQYPKGHKSVPGNVESWELWRNYTKKPYPSTLFVTLNEATPSIPQTTPTTRSMDPCQPEVGRESVDQVMSRLHSYHMHWSLRSSSKLDVPSRLPGHTCHLPTSLHSHLYPSHAGCSTLAFSLDGRYLGVGCIDRGNTYSLAVYEVSTMLLVLYSDAHRGLIYSLSWSHDSHMISTASADGLVKVWFITSGDEVASLPHPCYVYSACFTPTPTPHPPPSTPPSSHHYTLFTGAYDKIVRVWTLVPNRVQLIQELRGHRGHVNSICVASSEQMVFSGDSVGDVRVWRKEVAELWQLQRIISIHKSPIPILSLCLHPGGRRLLIHLSTGRLAMIDLRVDRECCCYGQLHSAGVRGSSVVTPCGMVVMGGGGEGEVKAWNCDNGELLHSFGPPALSNSPLSSLTYHPSLHLLAVSSLTPHHPISLLTHSQ